MEKETFSQSPFFAYHAVTEQPVHLGQHIIFDENHHNGVYKRVMDKKRIVNDIYSHPEKYYGKLQPGQEIKPSFLSIFKPGLPGINSI